MGNQEPTPEQLREAPLAFKGWTHLRLAFSRGLRDNPKTAYRLATGIRFKKR